MEEKLKIKEEKIYTVELISSESAIIRISDPEMGVTITIRDVDKYPFLKQIVMFLLNFGVMSSHGSINKYKKTITSKTIVKLIQYSLTQEQNRIALLILNFLGL